MKTVTVNMKDGSKMIYSTDLSGEDFYNKLMEQTGGNHSNYTVSE